MKIVFFGTPAFGVAPLEALCKSRHTVVAVVTQPDRAKNRHGEYIIGEVKKAAQQLNIPVYQFQSVKKEGVQALKDLGADIFVSAAYGQIFSQEIIDIPKYGILNIHASILPQYRGSSPVQWAIINGETETGITIMQTDLGLDTGDILSTQKLQIADDDTTDTLLSKLSSLGADLLLKTLDLIENGQISPIKQSEDRATKCPMIKKETGKIDWAQSARQIFNKIRAIECYTFICGKYVKILKAQILDEGLEGTAGEVLQDLTVQCGKGRLKILRLKPQNKNAMSATDYLLGNKIDSGMVLE